GLPLDRIVSPYGSESLTPGVLQAAATRYMPRDVYVQVTAMPSDSTIYTKAEKAEKGTARADSGKVGRGR
ncbi:MAG TPA: hypothetical protein VIP79_05065, partial [Gemmatimonadaceae bacterium]